MSPYVQLPVVPPPVVGGATEYVPLPSPFTPLALGATLKLWLRGDLGVTQGGGTASAWADQSGNANDCAEAVNKPSVISGLNGLQGLSFTTTKSLASAINAVPTGSARTIWIVMRNGAGTTGGPFQFKTGTPLFEVVWSSGGANTNVYTDGVGISTAIPTVSYDLACLYLMTWDGNTAHDVAVTLNGATPAISHNLGSGTASDSGASGYKVGAGFDGELYEIGVADTVLSAGNQALLAGYVLSRYGSLP